MDCTACLLRPVWHSPRRCREHFLAEFEERVRATVVEHGLIPAGSRVAVACSGGKDSSVLLALLRRWGHDVTALAVDEGIPGYRDASLETLRALCSRLDVPIRTASFQELAGAPLSEMAASPGARPCSLCGPLRRRLLHSLAQGYDLLATGHNADDEAQAVLLNLIRGNAQLWPRGGPKTRSAAGFIPRVKPLYFCTEKEVTIYAVLEGLAPAWSECPYAGRGVRNGPREALNAYEERHPGAKRRLLARYLTLRDRIPAVGDALRCVSCGELASGERCAPCRIVATIQR